MAYIDGFVAPVKPGTTQDEYRAAVEHTAAVFREHGATRIVESWADDVQPGKQTDFYRAVAAEERETVVFSWIEWPSKEARNAGFEKAMADPRLQGEQNLPFDMKRMIFGGFTVILDL
jgi:uncharacterized protein YbaA (DUF1428 family)